MCRPRISRTCPKVAGGGKREGKNWKYFAIYEDFIQMVSAIFMLKPSKLCDTDMRDAVL